MLRRATNLIDSKLRATDGELGSVKNLLFDDHSWQIRYMVVDADGWLRGRDVIVSPAAVMNPQWERGILPVSLTKDQIDASPPAEMNSFTRALESKIAGFFGWPFYWQTAGNFATGIVGQPPLPTEASARQNIRDEAVAPQSESKVRRTDDVVGMELRTTDAQSGRISGMLFDDQTWRIEKLIVAIDNGDVLIDLGSVRRLDWVHNQADADLTHAEVWNSPPANGH